ncbi:MAG TPA: arginase family protein [Thermoanaerobaculia bacterium]|nr:arginase family protein [Thermoanaerobaculia bacterium]
MTRYFTVPYDSGHKGLRMGAGPFRLAQELGVDAEEIAPAGTFPREITTAFELNRALATRVREANDFPVVLSGNCGSAIGAAAGLGTERLAVLWFDAHGDYNTPDTSDSGFLDGMCLSILTGRSFHNLAKTIPGFTPVPPSRTIQVGSRDYSPGEREALVADGVRMTPDFDGIDADRLLVHVDLDVIDPQFGRANHFAVGGGLSADDVLRVIEKAPFPIAGLVIASYDPACDPEGSIAAIAARIVRAVV